MGDIHIYRAANEPQLCTTERGRRLSVTFITTPLSTLLMWVALFTVSWDRLGQLQLGSFNLKLPIVAFALSAVLTGLDYIAKGGARWWHPVVTVVLTVIAVFAFAAMFASHRSLALLQTGTVFLGAVVPFVAVVANIRRFGNLAAALTAFIYGGIAASVFGLYQLFAFYTGLPQFVEYRAESGGLGRISAFSYEAGYFGYFLILVIAAVFAKAHLRGERASRVQLLFFVSVMILANSRATIFALPLVFVLLLLRQPPSSVRTKLMPVIGTGFVLLGSACLVFPPFFQAIAARAATVFDTTEETSNAPRLEWFRIGWKLAQENLLLGIGGGNLRDRSALMTGVVDDRLSSNQVITNNIWLQAMLDGGVVLLAAELALVVVAATTLYRRRTPVARFLMGGWLSVLIVSSVITSYYFDVKLWAVLGLALAAASLERDSSPAGVPPPFV